MKELLLKVGRISLLLRLVVRWSLKDLRNLAGLLNKLATWLLFGTDPRMTFSAYIWLRQWTVLIAVVDWLYLELFGEPDHCETAAQGWDQIRDMTIPWLWILPVRLAVIALVIRLFGGA